MYKYAHMYMATTVHTHVHVRDRAHKGGARHILEKGHFGALVLYLALSGSTNGESPTHNIVSEN